MKRIISLLSVLILCASLVQGQAGSGATLFYVVTAVDANGSESAFSNEASATVSPTLGHTVTLTWADAQTGVTFNAYRGTKSGGPYVRINTTPITALTYVDVVPFPNAPTGLGDTVAKP